MDPRRLQDAFRKPPETLELILNFDKSTLASDGDGKWRKNTVLEAPQLHFRGLQP